MDYNVRRSVWQLVIRVPADKGFVSSKELVQQYHGAVSGMPCVTELKLLFLEEAG
jgi:hypothetical protein